MSAPSRRLALFAATALPGLLAGMSGGALFSCGTSGVQIDPAVLDKINEALNKACGIVVFAKTIAGLIAAQFGSLIGAAVIADVVLEQIVKILCESFQAQSASGKLGATFVAGDKEIELHGWHIVDGKLVQF